MTKRKALGSGLEALLSNKPDSSTEKLKQHKTQKKQNISKNYFRNSPPEIDDVLNQDIDEDQTLNYNLSATDPDNDPDKVPR